MAIGVSPARLDFFVKKDESTSLKIFLQNFDANPTKVAIALSESKYEDRVSVTPSELIVARDTIQETEISVRAANNFSTEIEIRELAKSQGNLEMASGLKIPLAVSVQGSAGWLTWVLPIFLAAITTSLAFYLKRKKLKQAV